MPLIVLPQQGSAGQWVSRFGPTFWNIVGGGGTFNGGQNRYEVPTAIASNIDLSPTGGWEVGFNTTMCRVTWTEDSASPQTYDFIVTHTNTSTANMVGIADEQDGTVLDPTTQQSIFPVTLGGNTIGGFIMRVGSVVISGPELRVYDIEFFVP